MKDFQSKWDSHIEALALKMNNCKACNSVKEFAKSNLMLSRMRLALKQKLPGVCAFFAKCNNYQTPVINVYGKELMMPYQTRRFIVLSYAIVPLLLRRRGCFVRNYLFWSMLLCRENFNIRNYKFHQPQPPQSAQNPKK